MGSRVNPAKTAEPLLKQITQGPGNPRAPVRVINRSSGKTKYPQHTANQPIDRSSGNNKSLK